MASDLDIPAPPQPPDSLRSLSRKLEEALLGGGAFDRSGYVARRIVRDAAMEMLKIAAAFEQAGSHQQGAHANIVMFARARVQAARC